MINGTKFTESDLNYKFGGIFSVDDLPEIKTDTNELNQKKYSSVFGNCLCSLYGPLGGAYDNINPLKEEDEYNLCGIRYNKDDFNPAVGGYGDVGIDTVRNYYKSLGYKVSSIEMEFGSDDFYKLLDKGYRLAIGAYIRDGYKDDISDGLFTVDELGANISYGHFFSIKYNGDSYIIDNYKGLLPKNIYKIEDIEKFKDEGFFYKYAYLIYNTEKDMKEEIRNDINLESAKKAFDEGFWNGLEGDKPVSREEASAMIYRVFEKLK